MSEILGEQEIQNYLSQVWAGACLHMVGGAEHHGEGATDEGSV